MSTKDEHIATVLHAADVVCHMYSTVGVQAHLLGKKVIQPTYTHEFEGLNCVKVGISVGAASLDAITSEVLNAGRARPVRLGTGGAAFQVCRVIEQMLDQNKSD
jgi:hypothetical protein